MHQVDSTKFGTLPGPCEILQSMLEGSKCILVTGTKFDTLLVLFETL